MWTFLNIIILGAENCSFMVVLFSSLIIFGNLLRFLLWWFSPVCSCQTWSYPVTILINKLWSLPLANKTCILHHPFGLAVSIDWFTPIYRLKELLEYEMVHNGKRWNGVRICQKVAFPVFICLCLWHLPSKITESFLLQFSHFFPNYHLF